MSDEKVTAVDIVDALTERFSDTRQYIRGFEVGVTTGGIGRRIDCVIMDCYASNGFRVEGIEIKVSRADLRRELENTEKHAVFYENLDYFSLAAPAEIIDKNIIPPTWGLYAYKDGQLKRARKPLMLHDPPLETMSKGFAASFMRSATYRQHARSDIDAAVETAAHEAYQRGKDDTERRYSDSSVKHDLEHYEQYKEAFGSYLWGSELDRVGRLVSTIEESGLDRVCQLIRNLAFVLDETMEALNIEKPKPTGRSKH